MYLFYLDEGKTKLIVILEQTDHFEPRFLCPRKFKSCFLLQESKQSSHAKSQNSAVYIITEKYLENPN